MDVVKPEKYLYVKNRFQGKTSFVSVFAYSVLDGYIDGERYTDTGSLKKCWLRQIRGYSLYAGMQIIMKWRT